VFLLELSYYTSGQLVDACVGKQKGDPKVAAAFPFSSQGREVR
jgi:hypothetical protein